MDGAMLRHEGRSVVPVSHAARSNAWRHARQRDCTGRAGVAGGGAISGRGGASGGSSPRGASATASDRGTTTADDEASEGKLDSLGDRLLPAPFSAVPVALAVGRNAGIDRMLRPQAAQIDAPSRFSSEQ